MPIYFLLGPAVYAENTKIKIPQPADTVMASVEYADTLLKIKKSCEGIIFAESIDSKFNLASKKTKVIVEFTSFAKYKNLKIARLEATLGSDQTDVPLTIQKIELIPAPGSCLWKGK